MKAGSGGELDRCEACWLLVLAVSMDLGCVTEMCSSKAGCGRTCDRFEVSLLLAAAETSAGSRRAGAGRDGPASAVLTMCSHLGLSMARRPCASSSLRPFSYTFGSE